MIDIELIFTTISLLGMALVARHEVRGIGFFICIIGNVAWGILYLYTWHISMLLLFAGYFICNAVGLHDELTRRNL